MILLNPVVISVVFMCVLCLLRFNIFLAILVSALLAGVISGMGLIDTINLLISGMAGNLETALSYLLLGALAAAIGMTNLTAVLINFLSKFLSKKAFWFSLSIAFIACFSQNLIPVHIAFIPILIPPLLSLMNALKIDRRAVACALTFGLQAPYVSISVGFGLLFHTIIQKELANNGLNVELGEISSVMWLGGAAMLLGLFLALLYYRKPRDYKETCQDLKAHAGQGDLSNLSTQNANSQSSNLTNSNLKNSGSQNSRDFAPHELKMGKKEIVVLGGAIITFVAQIWSGSLPLGGILGLIFMIIFGGIEYAKIELTMEKGLMMMGFIAFIMLVAAGFGAVLRETGGIAELINFAQNISGGKLGGAIIMLSVGLLITIGIGSSFGTIPIIAAIYVPLCAALGFSAAATILLVGIAAAVGDAGSPASDSTLGPTSGLNSDGQHSHIYDTCVPTFVFFNIPLIICGVIFAMIL